MDLAYSTTMQTCQLNQINLLLTLFYVHKVQYISSCVLYLPIMTSFVNQFFYFRTEAFIFGNITLDYLQNRQPYLSYLVFYPNNIFCPFLFNQNRNSDGSSKEVLQIGVYTVFFSLDNSVLLCCRCLTSKFSENLLRVCRKMFSAFYLILHETFTNTCGLPLM